MVDKVFVNEKLSDEEAREYIQLLFDGYKARKRKKVLYRENDPIPEIIIKTYFQFVNKASFDDIYSSFRRKYINNENKVEQVHERSEQIGMGIVYDYLQSFDRYEDLNIYSILKIHALLFSKVPHPEFGGKFRNYDAYLQGTGVPTTPWSDVPSEMQSYYNGFKELLNEGLSLQHNFDANLLIDYINKCVKLKCDIIKIHPFADGNGRSTRALVNILFKVVNIPPVYISYSERDEYCNAMQKAVCEHDYSSINTFYHYKICDSIIEHDLSNIKDDSKKYVREK